MFKGIFTTIIVVAAAAGALAQQPAAVRVVGTVENFDGNVLAIKSEKLGEVKVNLTSDATVFGVMEAARRTRCGAASRRRASNFAGPSIAIISSPKAWAPLTTPGRDQTGPSPATAAPKYKW